MSEVRTEEAAVPHDAARWQVKTQIAKFEGDWSGEQIDAGEAPAPFDVVEDEGNLLLIGGVSLLWEIGNRAAGALEYLNNANARLGVGTSSTAEADTDTTLTAKATKAMDATYPTHTDSTGTVGSKTITFRSTFASADANQAWAEWGIDNGTRQLNRKVAANGTKASGQTWQFTVTITIA
jgi:DNA-binding transcriptional MocR family regulator